MIDFRETTVLVTQAATQRFPTSEGKIDAVDGWSVGAGLVLFNGTFGPREEREIRTIGANIASVAASGVNTVDLSMEPVWETKDFTGPTTLTGIVAARLT